MSSTLATSSLLSSSTALTSASCSSCSAAYGSFGLLDHSLGIIGKRLEELLHLLARCGVDIEVHPASINQEITVIDRVQKCLAQSGEALLRQLRRSGEWPAQNGLLEVQLKHLLVLV